MIAAAHRTGCAGDLKPQDGGRLSNDQRGTRAPIFTRLIVNTPPTSKRRPRAIRMGSVMDGATDAFRKSGRSALRLRPLCSTTAIGQWATDRRDYMPRRLSPILTSSHLRIFDASWPCGLGLADRRHFLEPPRHDVGAAVIGGTIGGGAESRRHAIHFRSNARGG
jgi:hypothetical protein